MKRLWFALIVLAISAASAFADVTVTMNMSMNAGPMAMSGQTTILVKGTKVRSDANIMRQDMSVLFDPATKQYLMLNHVTKEVTVFNPLQAMAGLPVTFGDARASVTPLAQTKEILGRVCQGFAIEIVMPMTMNGETLTMRATGPVWVAKDAPGAAEYKSAQKALADAGLSMSPFAQGPSAKGMVELAKTLAEAGMAMEQEIHIAIQGTGQMAQMMGQMGDTMMKLTVTGISTDPIPDSKFAIPADYAKK